MVGGASALDEAGITLKVVAVIQARFGASRLPGKVLLDLCGVTALQRCADRVRRIQGIDEVVVATSTEPKDDLVASLAGRLGVMVVRGSENDVLSRYALAVERTAADVVVRVTADCPFLDPEHAAAVLRAFEAADVDYASNVIERRLPRGLDTEVVSAEALHAAHRAATDPLDREHVTRFIYTRPQMHRCLSVVSTSDDHSSHRWTLDTADDYHLLYELHEALGPRAATASLNDILKVLASSPALSELNAHVQQKPS